jgi:RimJ/RimL family protein N-acetyltransferase
MTTRYGGPGVRLAGSGLVLREWERGDLAAMVELFDDPDVAFRTPLASPFDLVEAQAYLDRAQSDNGRLQLAITTDGERPLGEILLSNEHGSLGYAVGAAHRGQGLAVRAVRLMTEYAHGVVGIPRLVLEIEPDNVASSAVARGAGYQLTDQAPSAVADKGRSYTLLTWEHLTK